MTNPPVRIGQTEFCTYWQCETEADRDEYFAAGDHQKIPVKDGDCILVAEDAELFTWQNKAWHSLNS